MTNIDDAIRHEFQVAKQLDTEQDMVTLGIQRYRRERLPWNGAEGASKDEADLPPGQRLLRLTLEPLAAAIEAFMVAAVKGGSGRRHTAVKYLEGVDSLQAAYITARVAINAAAKADGFQTACMAIAKQVEEHRDMMQFAADAPGLYHLVQRQQKRATSGRHRSAVVRHAMRRADVVRLGWTISDRLHLGAKLLELMIESTGLLEKGEVPTRKGHTVYVLQPTEVTRAWLEDAHARCELLSPLHLPMVVEPRAWANPYTGGYLSNAIRIRLMKTRSKPYLDELGSVDMPEVYAAVNHVQRTAWKISRPVLDVMRTVWDGGSSLGGLPARDNTPLPARPADIDTNEQARKEWKAKAAKTHEENARLVSKRLAMSQKLWIAERFADEAAIYFPHQIDFRGRLYPLASFVNPQADDSGKALLEFAEGKPLGKDGGWWLAVHIANLFGVDKVSFEERVAWTEKHSAQLVDAAINPLDGGRFWLEADKPWCALAACYDWLGYQTHGEEHVSHTAIALDGSCSGLQHYSAALRDAVGGAAVNLVPSDKPQDIYTAVAKRAQAIVDASEQPELQPWKGGLVIRKIAKRPTMTYCYAATRFGMAAMIEEEVRKLDADARSIGAGPYLNGSDNHEASKALSYVIYQSIGEVVSSAAAAMDWLKAAARLAADDGLPVRWTTPVGLPVLQEYRQTKGQRFKVFFEGERLDLSLESEEKKIDKRGQASAIAPNFVHSLDAAHLMRTVTIAESNEIDSLCLIHDSFGTHAANTSVLAAALREAFVEQYEVDVLARFKAELEEQLPASIVALMPPLPPTGDLELASVLDSQFFFA